MRTIVLRLPDRPPAAGAAAGAAAPSTAPPPATACGPTAAVGTMAVAMAKKHKGVEGQSI